MATLTNIDKRGASDDFLLRESGFKLLRENGDGILVRAKVALINLAKNAASLVNTAIHIAALSNIAKNTATLSNTASHTASMTNINKN